MIECTDPVDQVRVKLSEAHRTGRLFTMLREGFNKMFDTKTNAPFVMITKDLGDLLQANIDEIQAPQ
jgi:hypothetical protein